MGSAEWGWLQFVSFLAKRKVVKSFKFVLWARVLKYSNHSPKLYFPFPGTFGASATMLGGWVKTLPSSVSTRRQPTFWKRCRKADLRPLTERARASARRLRRIIANGLNLIRGRSAPHLTFPDNYSLKYLMWEVWNDCVPEGVQHLLSVPLSFVRSISPLRKRTRQHWLSALPCSGSASGAQQMHQEDVYNSLTSFSKFSSAREKVFSGGKVWEQHINFQTFRELSET